MSIPLDNLYNYINSLFDDDILIYRWQPHGSKKLSDLAKLNDDFGSIQFRDNNQLSSPGNVECVKRSFWSPSMICHDQEPLCYDLYSKEDLLRSIKNSVFREHPKLSKLMTESHIRAALDYPLNLNKYTLLCHSEKNSEQLSYYEQNNFLGVYYWSHALIARDWFRFAEYDNHLDFKIENITQDFLIYNRAWAGTREYRLKFLELLVNNDLLGHCNVKFNPVDLDVHYTQHIFHNPELKISRFDFEHLVPINQSHSSSSADYNSNDYKTSGIEIVLETLFDDQRQHLTEKALRPIACGKPFILAGTAGSLEYLKSYGFQTFQGLIDESYDTIQNPVKRLFAITKEVSRISNLEHKQKKDLLIDLHRIAAYNKNRFFSKDFHNIVVDEFLGNARTAMKKCSENKTMFWANLVKDYDLLPENHKFYYSELLSWAEEKITTESFQ